MDVRLSPEQRALRDSATQLVDRLGPKTVGELDDAERAAKLDAAVAAAGWRELRTPTDDGCPLASGVEVAIVAEEMGRRLADTAFAGPTLSTELRRLTGTPMASSTETVSFTSDLSAPAAVDGALPADAVAVDANGATEALVLVPLAAGYELGKVEVSGVEVRADLTRSVATVAAEADVVAVADQAEPLTSDALARWTAFGLALTCADLVGTMRGAVDLACAYAKERRQYERPIGSFQALQHLLADAYVSMEGSRSAALHAAWAVDALPPADALAAAAVAKAYSARAARTVCETAIQVHGGLGNTWECLAHVHLRRCLLASDLLGGVGPSLARVLDHHGIGGDRGLR